MAQVYTYNSWSYQSWNADNAQVTNSLYDMMSKYDTRFSHSSGSNVITIDNEFNIVITTSGTSYRYYATVSVRDPNNSSSEIAQYYFRYTGWNARPGSWNCKLYKSDNVYYLYFRANDSGDEQNYLGGVIYWYKKDGKSYFGIIGNTADTVSHIPCSSMNIERLSVIGTSDKLRYSFAKIADYSMPSIDDLFFTQTNLLIASNGQFEKQEDLYSTSNMTFRKTISVNNKNYYSIGTNVLIEIDS